MKFLLPKQPIFGQLFLQVNQCVFDMTALLDEMTTKFTDVELFAVRARTIEHRADEVIHEIIDHLNKSFITPFDREDIYLLARAMDALIDYLEETIQSFSLYHIAQKRHNVDAFSHIVKDVARLLTDLLHECFDEQSITKRAKDLIKQIHLLENEGDEIFRNAIQQLFQEEHDALAVLKWKDIFENLEHIIDQFCTVSDTIESMMVKSS